MRSLLSLTCVGAVVAGAASCSSRHPAVATFEDFYAASTHQDAAGVRGLLCPPERRILGAATDEALLAAMAVKKVLREVRLESSSSSSSVVVVVDALGQAERFQLRHDVHASRGWCVSGPASAGGSP